MNETLVAEVLFLINTLPSPIPTPGINLMEEN